MKLAKLICAAFLVLGGPAYADGPNDARLSLAATPYLSADVSSAVLYYVRLDGLAIATAGLTGVNGLADAYYETGNWTLCLQPWPGVAPPAQTCAGLYVGTINPVNGVARCDLTRKLYPRCDVWNYYNRAPLVLEIGGATDLVPPPVCCAFNNWYRVPTDRVVRNYWQEAGYSATLLQGRAIEKSTAQIQGQASIYTHNNYSPGTGLLYYQLGIALDAIPQNSAGHCGFLSTRAQHMDSSVAVDRMVSDDGAPTPGVCIVPPFAGTKQVIATESAGDNGMVLSSGARWSFQFTVRASY